MCPFTEQNAKGIIRSSDRESRKTKYSNSYWNPFPRFPASTRLEIYVQKSLSKPNCLAVSDSHVFAAQSDKATIHVYNRERNTLEAVVPFPEKISCIALAGHSKGAGILIIGTHEGRLIIWELASGRQVFTGQQHLQKVNCLAIDITSNFILSGSDDQNVHLWSLPKLLSFPSDYFDRDVSLSPSRTFSQHRAALTSLVFGHSASRNDIAVSLARDQKCFVWDYHEGTMLHSYLLPNLPLCVDLDSVGRAAYVGYEDGNLQIIDFYKGSSLVHPLHDRSQQYTPTQLLEADVWTTKGDHKSSALCLAVSYDGTFILSGHEDGKILSWDISSGRYRQIADFAAPVTNLKMLPPIGFLNLPKKSLKLHNVVKPRYENVTDTNRGTTGIPQDYNISVQLCTDLPATNATDYNSFCEELTQPSFLPGLLQEYLAETVAQDDSGFGQDSETSIELKKQNTSIAQQLQSTKERMKELERASWRRKQEDEIKAARKKRRRLREIKIDEVKRRRHMGVPIEGSDVEMEEEDEDEDDASLSSDTDEITDSN